MLASSTYLAALQRAKSTRQPEHIKAALELLSQVNNLTSSQETYVAEREEELR